MALGAYELEVGLQRSQSPGERHVDLPLGLAYGLAPRLEIGIGWGVHLRDRIAGSNPGDTVSGQQDISLGFKWMPLQTEAGLQLALAGSTKLATASRRKGLGSGDEDYDLTLIVTQSWDAIALDVNLGHTWVGGRFDPSLTDNVHYGAAVRFSSTPKLTWVGEVFADDPKGSRALWQANAGVQYAVRKNVAIDAALGRRLSASGPDWVAKLGFTATF